MFKTRQWTIENCRQFVKRTVDFPYTVTQTIVKSNLMLTWTKIDFSWISFIYYCNFTLGNLNPQ